MVRVPEHILNGHLLIVKQIDDSIPCNRLPSLGLATSFQADDVLVFEDALALQVVRIDLDQAFPDWKLICVSAKHWTVGGAPVAELCT